MDQLEDEIVLLLCLNRDGIHAVFTAEITSLEPVDTLGGECGNFATVEIVVTFIVELFGTWERGREEDGDQLGFSLTLRAILSV